jgi:glycosyltransferase involved in cell wall biosynthesis
LNRARRLLFDVTYTRTQDRNVGITRTVKRLRDELAVLAPAQGMGFGQVMFNTGGFRAVPQAAAEQQDRVTTPERSLMEKAWVWIATGPIYKFASARLPLRLKWWAWSMFSRWEFNRLSGGAPEIDVGPGDVLFLCDASWSYRVWIAARLARKRGATVVTVVYDLIPLRHPEYCTPLTVIELGNWVRKQLPSSDAILCISRAVEDDLRQYAVETGLKMPPMAHFRLGSDPISSTVGAGEVRQAVRDFMRGGACFTAIGSFEPRKNYGLVLDAFERLWTCGTDARVMIIGRRDAQCPDLLERIERHGELGKRLLAVFDGTDDEVAFGYENSRALLFPSLAEGFGLPLVEARGRGCRVIASDLPVFLELADPGVSIFPRDSAAALADLVLAHMQHDRPKSPMAPFTWEDSARRCLALIDEFEAAKRAAGTQ